MGQAESIIKSLDKNELRFISNQILADKNSQAKKLFELIVQFGDEEEKIAARFGRAAPKGNLSVVRNQLQKVLLKASEQYHAGNYVETDINSLILQIKIFSEKRLFDVVKALFAKALEIAAANELFMQWMELLELKLNFIQTKNYPEEDTPEYLLGESKKIFLKLQNHTAYRWLLIEEMELANKSYMLRNEEALQKWGDILQNDLLSSPDKALSTKARLDYWAIKAQYFIITNQHAEAAACFKEIIDVFEQNSVFKKLRCLYFIWANCQLAHLSYLLKDTELTKKCIDAMKTTQTYSDEERECLFTYYIESSIQYFSLINDNDSIKKLLDEAHTGLRPWKAKMRLENLMSLIFCCIGTWIEMGEYEKALAMVREFNEYVYADYRLDIKIAILFYELIAQIESGNELMVNNTLQNFNRFLLRHDFKSEFEQLMIRFLKIISSGHTKARDELKALKGQLLDIPNKSILNQHAVLYPTLMDLIDSKLARKKYHEYVRGKAA